MEYVGAPDIPAHHAISELRKGAVYVVTEVGRRCSDRKGRIYPSIRVAGAPTVGPDGYPLSYPVIAFRPIYRPKCSLIDTLKQPVSEDA